MFPAQDELKILQDQAAAEAVPTILRQAHLTAEAAENSNKIYNAVLKVDSRFQNSIIFLTYAKNILNIRQNILDKRQ